MPRGRPKLDIAVRLRRQIWCDVVIRQSGMSLYQLDYFFDLKLLDKAETNPKNTADSHAKNKASSKTTYDKRRRKIFSDLLHKNIMPFQVEDRVSKFIEEVNKHYLLDNTAIVYESSFWSFVDKTPMSLLKIREMIVKILGDNNLFNDDVLFPIDGDSTKDFLEFLSIHGEDLTYKDFKLTQFKIGLHEIYTRIYFQLDRLAFLGALMRENYLIGDLEIAKLLEQLFFEMKDEILSETELIPEHLIEDFNLLCESRLIAHYSVSTDLPAAYSSLVGAGVNPKSVGAIVLRKQESLIRKYKA